MNDKKMYVLFHCDEWKSKNSMSLIGVFDEDSVRKVIKKRVRNNEFELDVEEVDELSINDINSNLKYAHIETVELNEILD